jgi:hypothetical protein
VSDELRRKLARAAGDVESFRLLGMLLRREGKDVESAAASLLGFTSSAPEAFRAIRNNVLVKATVDVLNRERARWTGEQLRRLAQTRTLTDRTREDLLVLARRIEHQRYPEFFEEWAAVNESLRLPLEESVALTPEQRRILNLSTSPANEPAASPPASSSSEGPAPG